MNLRLERARLFERYSTNLGLYRPKFDGLFICPICLDGFTREALDQDLLAVEHCVPESVGGSLLTLTCKKCNNENGAKIDSHLSERLRADDFAEAVGQGPYDAVVTVEGNPVRANVTFERGEMHTIESRVVRRATNPTKLQAALDELSSGKIGITVNMNFTFKFNQQVARVALMRAAYLIMFRYYGYSYVFYNQVSMIRNQICNPREDIVPQAAILQLPQDSCQPNVPGIVKSPTQFRSYLVPIKVKSANRSRVFGVFLPGFGDGAERLYNFIREDVKTRNSAQVTFSPFDFHPDLMNGPDPITPLGLWDKTFGNPPRMMVWSESDDSAGAKDSHRS
jgi:hypothetical protein